jgi:CSLREA domain-containing protein
MKAFETSNTTHRGRRVICGVATALLCLLGVAPAAGAATINVTTTTDEFAAGSRCSLREAVWAANNDSIAMAPGCVAGSGSDTIVVPPGVFNLSRADSIPSSPVEDADLNGDLDVTGPTSIVHRGIRPAVIAGSGGRVFHTMSPAGINLEGLTIRGGVAAGPDDHGGGILNEGVLSVVNSTITANRAVFGGGLSTEGASSAVLTNVTISDNVADADGGGISVETGGSVSLKNVTVAKNSADGDRSGGGDGGGLFASTSGGGGVITLRDTLVADNRDYGNEVPDCAKLGGTITSQGRNLIGNTNGCDYVQGPGDIVNRGAQLASLGDNGGPTATHALKKTSPAIGLGAGCARTDQRGVTRALGGKCDIGAWELIRCQGVVVNRVGTTGPDLLTGTRFADGFLALGGNDTAQGLGSRDGICGGTGSDRLEGGAGNDSLDGGAGRDTCLGGGGRNSAVKCELPKRKHHKAHHRPKGHKKHGK